MLTRVCLPVVPGSGLRFPALANAPLVESRVCQYENSTDQDFILDCHPEAENVWVVGGGSGHGFKHGPVLGDMVSDAVLGLKRPPAEGNFQSIRSDLIRQFRSDDGQPFPNLA
jgi:glycine/D-amino acid oxidase-like deaminating enzyme